MSPLSFYIIGNVWKQENEFTCIRIKPRADGSLSIDSYVATGRIRVITVPLL